MLVALTFLLATLHFGPEMPIGPRLIGAAISNQDSPSAAWNGQTGLVVWVDERSGTQMLRVSRMNADGSLVNAAGTPLFPAVKARIASNGSSTFMLAYSDAEGTWSVLLDEN